MQLNILRLFFATFFILVTACIILGLSGFLSLSEAHRKKNPAAAAEKDYDVVASKVTRKSFVYKNVTIDGGKLVFKFKSYFEMDRKNDVIFLKDNCLNQNIVEEQKKVNNGKLILLTNFLYFKLASYRSNMHWGEGKLTDEILEARIMEVLDVVQDNLQHPYIQEIHMLVHEQEAVDFLKKIEFKNGKKLVVKLTKEPVTMKVQILYASSCLKNKVVAISHQDNKFGRGWDIFSPEILRSKKIMYALTRHTALNISCGGSQGSAHCDPGYPYLGSHDTFVYSVGNGFTASELKLMDNITPNLYGMENVMISMFTKLGYKVMNPCPIFYVHHHHCIAIRDGGRKRVNTAATTGYASFTNDVQ